METKFGELTVQLAQGDITRQADLDAIVNAANAQLQSGGGVAGAIHRAAGPELAAACRPLAPIRPGEAVITPAYRLPNRFVIHCLGPVYGHDEPAAELLAQCYQHALGLAEDEGLGSIGFPALSTGAFGYPVGEAAPIALRAIQACAPSLRHIRLVRMVLFSKTDLDVHQKALAALDLRTRSG
jgi:O-acetyl-ADP-ribose deacetylase (regulator of RNase III)